MTVHNQQHTMTWNDKTEITKFFIFYVFCFLFWVSICVQLRMQMRWKKKRFLLFFVFVLFCFLFLFFCFSFFFALLFGCGERKIVAVFAAQWNVLSQNLLWNKLEREKRKKERKKKKKKVFLRRFVFCEEKVPKFVRNEMCFWETFSFWFWNAKNKLLVSRKCSPVLTQIIWTFDIKLAKNSANKSLFFVFVLFGRVWFGGNEMLVRFTRSLKSKQFVVWCQTARILRVILFFPNSNEIFWFWNAKNKLL